MGSRMMVRGAARSGRDAALQAPRQQGPHGRAETACWGTSFSEFHSGYRAYRVDALRSIPFERDWDGFDFDTQIIVQLVDGGRGGGSSRCRFHLLRQ